MKDVDLRLAADGDKTWTVTLPDGTRVGSRTLSKNSAAAASFRNLVFTFNGASRGEPLRSREATWKYVLAFTLVYLAWGTTYWAIKRGGESFPPWLFGGVRILLAGLILMAYLRLRGESLRLSRHDFLGAAIAALLMFVIGNGLITIGEQTVDSGVTAVMVATSPLWIALWETVWPRGERLRPIGWLGVLAGLAGVILLVPNPRALLEQGPVYVIGSSVFWATGSFVLRHWKRTGSLVLSAAYQMILGGIGQIAIALAVGEPWELAERTITPVGIYSFFHLLIIGSLVGYVAYNWLLSHVSATLAGTYAYVNPVIALLFSMLVTDERVMDWRIWLGMAVILGGVALVRLGAGTFSGGSVAANVEDVVTTDPAIANESKTAEKAAC